MPRSRTVNLRWNALLNDFRRSGLTQAEFCRRRRISLHSFRKHLYQPRPSQTASGDHRPPAADHHFLPVIILPDPAPASTDPHPTSNSSCRDVAGIMPASRALIAAPCTPG